MLAANTCQAAAPNVYSATSLTDIGRIPNARVGDWLLLVDGDTTEFSVWKVLDSDAEPDGTTTIATAAGCGLWTEMSLSGGGGGVGALIYSGTGSPEGVVTANPLSLYYKTDAPIAFWIKASGAGDTGWVELLSA